MKQDIKMLQTQSSMIINQEIEWEIKYLKQKQFEQVREIIGLENKEETRKTLH